MTQTDRELDDAPGLIREVEATARRLRECFRANARNPDAKALMDGLLVDLPRRIRRLPVGRSDARCAWQAQVLSFDPRQLPFAHALRFRIWRWRLRKLPRMVETLAYGFGIMAAFRYLNRHAKRVLTFHNVLPDALCTCDLASAVTLPSSVFEKMIRRLRRHYRFSTDFEDASTLTVTFDDGYRCQFETAGEILERLNVPAVVFAAGNVLSADDPRKSLAVDRLLLWASYAPTEALAAFAGSPIRSRVAFWYESLEPAFRQDAAARGEGVFRRVDALFPFQRILDGRDPEWMRLRLTGPDAVRVARLRARGWKLGWHTQSHFPLAHLSDAQARRELTPADAACLALPVSYPYGTPAAVSDRDERMARDIGFPGGYSNLSAPNVREGDFFRLRFTLTGDRIEDEALLSGFRYFMETRRLLPHSHSKNPISERKVKDGH